MWEEATFTNQEVDHSTILAAGNIQSSFCQHFGNAALNYTSQGGWSSSGLSKLSFSWEETVVILVATLLFESSLGLPPPDRAL